MRTKASQRLAAFGPYVGKTVIVKVKKNNYSDDVIEMHGIVLAVASRLKGTADFRGTQYDMVLHIRRRAAACTFALSRIVSIEELS